MEVPKIIRSYIPPFRRIKGRKKSFFSPTWEYNPLSLTTGETIKIPIKYKDSWEILNVFLNISFPKDFKFEKEGKYYTFDCPLNFLMKNRVFRRIIIHGLICFRDKKAYLKDDDCGDIRCELYDRELWMRCERIIAKLENRDTLREPREEYLIYRD